MRFRCRRSNVSGVTIQPDRLGRGSAVAIAPSTAPVVVVEGWPVDLAA
jgi:hypothetical protein